jgi:hypothetical protein
VQEESDQVVQLRRLAAELARQGLQASIVTTAKHPYLQAVNPDNPELQERVLCSPAADGSWCFWWPWRQPIGSADDLTGVSHKIMTVLRSVEGGS